MHHPYLSSDRDHDQQVVATAINKIVEHSNDMIKSEIKPNLMIIESDNAVQYKYAEHFHAMQKFCDRQNKKIKRGYGIAQHGKGEVDHVSGIARKFVGVASFSQIFKSLQQW